MARCNFCGNIIRLGTGILYAKKDGRILNFCSRKCERHVLFLKRKPVEHKWTQAFRKKK